MKAAIQPPAARAAIMAFVPAMIALTIEIADFAALFAVNTAVRSAMRVCCALERAVLYAVCAAC